MKRIQMIAALTLIVMSGCSRSDSTGSKGDATHNNPTNVTPQSQAAISPYKGQPDIPSSIPAPLAAPQATAEIYTTGTFTDARDGKTYKTVKLVSR
jgi:PBP1b-binding outer membrane lipoprotein LpoB